MRSVRPDLIHNVTVKPIVYGTIAARREGVPRIVNAVSGLGHAFSGRRSRRAFAHLVKMAYRAALGGSDARVIFQNEDDLRALVSSSVISARQAILIRGSGVNLEAFPYTPEMSGDSVVVLPARMLRDKGVLEFARAARILRSSGEAAEFVLAGMIDEENRSSLQATELASLERETGVKWLGHISDMASLYQRSHIVCLPSYYGEGLPKSLLEACASGRPIVTTDVPGCRDAVRHGENGLLVEARNVDALAGALRRLISDSTLRTQMGAAGRRRAEAEFDVRSVVQATLGVYRDMLA